MFITISLLMTAACLLPAVGKLGHCLGTSYFRIADQLTGDEPRYLRRTRALADSEAPGSEALPVINGCREHAEFPWPPIKKLAKLRIVGGGDPCERVPVKGWLSRSRQRHLEARHEAVAASGTIGSEGKTAACCAELRDD